MTQPHRSSSARCRRRGQRPGRRGPGGRASCRGGDRAGVRRSDTVLTGCTDHTAGPHTAPGSRVRPRSRPACRARTPRALPHQLPEQVTAADHLAALRAHLDPPVWRARYATAFDQLTDILGHYTAAERDHARTTVTTGQRDLVNQVLDGRWDLR